MTEVIFSDRFKRLFSRIKDSSIKKKIIKQLEKIKANPEVGKPMKHKRKGTRELYIPPFRLSYNYFREKDLVYILNLYHKDEQ